jgi:hypothetical protein
MQIQAIEQWVDGGWSPWRIASALITAVVTVAAVLGYVASAHHPGSVWWVMAGVGVLTLWALSEMLRWRIKYKRLLASRERPLVFEPQLVTRETQTADRLRHQIRDGRLLQSKIKTAVADGNSQRWPSVPDTVPDSMAPEIIEWEASVTDTLARYPKERVEFTTSIQLLHKVSGLGSLDRAGALRIIEDSLSLLGSFADKIDRQAADR